MAGVAQAYQHLLTIDCLLLSGLPGVSSCAFIGQMTPFIALIQLSLIK